MSDTVPGRIIEWVKLMVLECVAGIISLTVFVLLFLLCYVIILPQSRFNSDWNWLVSLFVAFALFEVFDGFFTFVFGRRNRERN